MGSRQALFATLLVGLALAPTADAEDGGLRLEVDRSERELRVYVDGELVETHPVVIGKQGYATPVGTWAYSPLSGSAGVAPP